MPCEKKQKEYCSSFLLSSFPSPARSKELLVQVQLVGIGLWPKRMEEKAALESVSRMTSHGPTHFQAE